MDIKDVKIHAPTTKEAGGLVIPPVFLMELSNGEIVSVPHDPLNSDYMRIAEWYDRKKNKPFDFEFEATKDLTGESDDSAPIPQQKPTEAKPDSLNEVNLTQKQIKEIEKEQADAVKRGSAGRSNLGS